MLLMKKDQHLVGLFNLWRCRFRNRFFPSQN